MSLRCFNGPFLRPAAVIWGSCWRTAQTSQSCRNASSCPRQMKRGIGGQKGETRNGVPPPAEAARRKQLLDWLPGADLASCSTPRNHNYTARNRNNMPGVSCCSAHLLSRITVTIQLAPIFVPIRTKSRAADLRLDRGSHFTCRFHRRNSPGAASPRLLQHTLRASRPVLGWMHSSLRPS